MRAIFISYRREDVEGHVATTNSLEAPFSPTERSRAVSANSGSCNTDTTWSSTGGPMQKTERTRSA